jgi:hypothetical protein
MAAADKGSLIEGGSIIFATSIYAKGIESMATDSRWERRLMWRSSLRPDITA